MKKFDDNFASEAKRFQRRYKDIVANKSSKKLVSRLENLINDLLIEFNDMEKAFDFYQMYKFKKIFLDVKPDTPENVGIILRAIDKDLIVNRITTVDGVLNSFEVGTAGYLMGIVKKDSDGYWNFQTYLGSQRINKCSETESEVTIENDKVKELSEILPVIDMFIKLQEADNEQD